MITDVQIFEIMRPIILSVTGIPEVILADPNAPSPSGDYAAVRSKGALVQQGQANILKANGVAANTVDIEVRAQVVDELLVDFYVRSPPPAMNAMCYASLLFQANKRPDVSQALIKASPQPIGWQRSGPVHNLTALQSNNWEQRAQISIYLLYDMRPVAPINVNSIEQVLVTIEDENGDDLISENIASEDAP